MAQGINIGRVFAIAWGAGAVLAALGGLFATQPPIRQTGAIDPESSLVAFRALPAVVLGALASVRLRISAGSCGPAVASSTVASSTPEHVGMYTSISTTSGARSGTASTASAPLVRASGREKS